jgi:hypothetical protein
MMSSLKRKIPQEGTGSAGESLMELCSVCPEDSGGGKNSIGEPLIGRSTEDGRSLDSKSSVCTIVGSQNFRNDRERIGCKEWHVLYDTQMQKVEEAAEILIDVRETVKGSAKPKVAASNLLRARLRGLKDLWDARPNPSSWFYFENRCGCDQALTTNKVDTGLLGISRTKENRPEATETIISAKKGGKGGKSTKPKASQGNEGKVEGNNVVPKTQTREIMSETARNTKDGGRLSVPKPSKMVTRSQKRQENVGTVAPSHLIEKNREETARNPEAKTEPEPASKATNVPQWTEVVKRKGTKAVDSREVKSRLATESSRKTPRKRLKKMFKEAILIRADPQGYPGIVRRVTKELPNAREKISSVKRVSGGTVLLFELEVRGAEADSVMTEIQNLAGEVKITKSAPKLTYIVDHLDEGVEEKELVMALREKLGLAEAEDVKVLSLRPSYGLTRRCVVQVPRSERAAALEKFDNFRVGLNRCRVRQRRRPNWCSRCWKPGHSSKDCKSLEDRSNLCLNCGSGGHKAVLCVRPANCVLCTADGLSPAKAKHRCASASCLAFKKEAVRNAR